jgi:hypothetical protein
MNLFLPDGNSVHVDHCDDGVLLVLIHGKREEISLMLSPEQAGIVAKFLVEHSEKARLRYRQ